MGKVKKVTKVKEEIIQPKIEGIWWDVIYERNANGIERIVRTTKKHNTIMTKLANLFAGLLQNDSNFVGIARHSLGNGLAAWDSSPTPPSVSVSNEYLEAEYYRKEPDLIEYIDGAGAPFSPTGTPGTDYVVQPRVRIKTTFNYDDANGEWIREQAIFAGDATGSLDSGHIINIIRHPRIRKEDNIKIERFIQFNITIT